MRAYKNFIVTFTTNFIFCWFSYLDGFLWTFWDKLYESGFAASELEYKSDEVDDDLFQWDDDALHFSTESMSVNDDDEDLLPDDDEEFDATLSLLPKDALSSDLSKAGPCIAQSLKNKKSLLLN